MSAYFAALRELLLVEAARARHYDLSWTERATTACCGGWRLGRARAPAAGRSATGAVQQAWVGLGSCCAGEWRRLVRDAAAEPEVRQLLRRRAVQAAQAAGFARAQADSAVEVGRYERVVGGWLTEEQRRGEA